MTAQEKKNALDKELELIKLIDGIWHSRRHTGDGFEVMREGEARDRGLVHER